MDQFPRVQTLGTATQHLQFIQKQKTCVDGRCACRLSSGEGTPWLAMSGPTSHNQLQLDFRQDLHQLGEALGGVWWLSTRGFSLLPLKHCSHHAELDSSPLAVVLQFCSDAVSADKYIVLYRHVIKWWHNIGAEESLTLISVHTGDSPAWSLLFAPPGSLVMAPAPPAPLAATALPSSGHIPRGQLWHPTGELGRDEWL